LIVFTLRTVVAFLSKASALAVVTFAAAMATYTHTTPLARSPTAVALAITFRHSLVPDIAFDPLLF